MNSFLSFILDLESQSSQTLKELRQQVHDLEKANANLRNDLATEQKNRFHLETEHSSCVNRFKQYQIQIEDKNKKLKEIKKKHELLLTTKNVDNLSVHEEDNILTEDIQDDKPCSGCCRKATEDLERRLKKHNSNYYSV